MQYIPLVSLGLLSAAFVGIFFWQRLVYKTSIAAIVKNYEHAIEKQEETHNGNLDRLESEIERLDVRYEASLDRLYLKQALPPSSADLGAEYQERREKNKQAAEERAELIRKNGGPIPPRIGLVDSAQLKMEVYERQQLGKSKAS